MHAVDARPYTFELDAQKAALLIIDMQRDFLEPGGFGAALGNDVAIVRKAIEPTTRVLAAARAARACWSHTRGRGIARTFRTCPLPSTGADGLPCE